MPKYVLIGLVVSVTIFILMHLSSKLSAKTKKIIINFFYGILLIAALIIAYLLIN